MENDINDIWKLAYREPSGNVQELVKERAHTWQSVVFSWLSVFCFGPKIYIEILNG